MVVRCRLKTRSQGCRTVIPSDGIFSSHWTTIVDSFSCILFLRLWHLNFYMRYFINIMLKYPHFQSKRSVRLPSMTLTLKRLAENEIKTDVITSKRYSDVIHESRLIPLVVRRHFLARSITWKFLSGMQESCLLSWYFLLPRVRFWTNAGF